MALLAASDPGLIWANEDKAHRSTPRACAKGKVVESGGFQCLVFPQYLGHLVGKHFFRMCYKTANQMN